LPKTYVELIASLRAKSIVCPQPKPWDKLVTFLKGTKQIKHYPLKQGTSLQVANPLILAAWRASDQEKWTRFKYHLKEADDLGVLWLIEEFLDKLEEKDFLLSKGVRSDNSL
jgi:hypothetical protein